MPTGAAMHVSTFSCPHCAASLRIRDRMFVGKTVGCPDCGEQLQIVADGAKGFRAEKFVSPEQPSPSKKRKRKSRSLNNPDDSGESLGRKKRRRAGKKNPTNDSGRFAPLIAKLTTPLAIAWGTAIIAATVIAAVMLSGSNKNGNGSTAKRDSKTEAEVGVTPGEISQANPWDATGDNPRDRLLQLARVLAHYEKMQKEFPAGTVAADGVPPEERFSWMARLAALEQEYGSSQPRWERPWSDPANERFRTQSIPLFRNPQLPATPGRDGLPVTHFVGVAGVGEDGPLLPVDHPRAGIFGYNRSTQRRDIKDGLSNTMMLAGANRQIGGWAVGGRATIRPFTKTPYVDGPDGFGSSHAGRMMVLMADGSVREISAKIDPVIVRRMAAMADGFPLDLNVPGDPGTLGPAKKPGTKIGPPPIIGKKNPQKMDVPKIVEVPVRASKPRLPPFGVEPKRVDVAAALAQPILRFQQTKPQPFGHLLDELEEMAGVPMRFDKEAIAAELLLPVAVQLENVTVKGILQSLVAKVGLTYKVETDGIRILKKTAKP